MRFMIFLPVLILLLPAEASAHVGLHAQATFSSGLFHPFSGLDHILAMLAVGMWAGWLGGSFRWTIPAGFVAAAAAGFLLGLDGSEAFGLIEQGIAISLVGLGVLLALRARLSLTIGLPLVAVFGLFHGLAHGSEVSSGGGEWLFMSGFLAATVCLHLCGFSLGSMAMREALLRVSGAGIAAVGLVTVVMNLT